jgi:succinate-semialdehyde dehydrogenase/glutarate-semialdehyde dehydrogenase
LGVLCGDAGIPAGVVNILTGDTLSIGSEFLTSPFVKKIRLVGSISDAQLLAARAVQRGKRLSTELCGNAPFVVFDDADIDSAIRGALATKYDGSGRTFVNATRFLIQDGVYDKFAREFAAAVSMMRIGNGFDANVDSGPLIDAEAVRAVEDHLLDASSKGAIVITGGRRHGLGGTFFEPTVVIDATMTMSVAREDTLGPLAPLFRFRGEADAIQLANDAASRAACYLYTNDVGRAFRVSSMLEYGIIAVNQGLNTTEVLSFDDLKQPDFKRLGSVPGVADYFDTKWIWLKGPRISW